MTADEENERNFDYFSLKFRTKNRGKLLLKHLYHNDPPQNEAT